MILGRFLTVGVMGACILAPTIAHADVLEIGEQGHRWVVGAPAHVVPDETAALAALQPQDGSDLVADMMPEGFAVPEQAVAHTHMSAAAVPVAYQAKVAELSARFDLSPALIEALVWQESRWRSGAVSPVGARGLAQLMPGTARELGVNSADPFANLEGGARYLRQQMDRFGGDVEKSLAAYNAGPGRVIKSGGVPRIRETQGYVAAIMGRLSNHSREQ